MLLKRRNFGQMAAAALGSMVLPAEASSAAGAELYPGERVIEAAGFPSLVKFVKGDPAKPLAVFVPGTSFLARIAYDFPGGRADDFLGRWIVAEGYSFLGVSYPLANAVYDRVYPEFGITDWGNQVIAAAARSIQENRLGKSIVVIGWSMGGKPAVTVARAARKAGLDLRLFVALDALAPGPNLFPGNAEQLRLAPNKMVDQVDLLLPWFLDMLQAQNKIAGHEIIPPGILKSQIVGNPPLGIQGENAQLRDGRMVLDSAAAATDAGTSDYDDYPPIGLVISDAAADYPNVLLCRSNWGLPVGQQLYRTLVYPHRERLTRLPPTQWKLLQALMASAMERLTVQIHGTHFMFVGEPGARAVARAVTNLQTQSAKIREEIAAIVDHI